MIEKREILDASARELGYSRPVALLLQCLSFGEWPGGPGGPASGAGFLADETVRTAIFAVGQLNDLLPAVAYRHARHCLPNDAASEPVTGSTNGEQQLRDHLASHRYRCIMQRKCLVEVARALNGCGIEPWLMTSADVVWSGQPRWQYARGLGVLVPHDGLDRAKAALAGLGYAQARRLDQAGYTSETQWLRADLSGWLALAGAGDNPGIERIVPDSKIENSGSRAEADGAVVRLLPPPLAMVHAMLHHHTCKGQGWRKTTTLKSLYEFGWRVNQATNAEREMLRDLADCNRALAEVMDAWLEASKRVFNLAAGIGREWVNRGDRLNVRINSADGSI